jgi:hypothetical protein
VPEGQLEFYHLGARVGNLELLKHGLLPTEVASIYDFGPSLYFSLQLEHCVHWLKTKRGSPVSILVFRVPANMLEKFHGLKIENDEVALWQDIVKGNLKKTLPVGRDFIEGPCCANSVQVARWDDPQLLRSSGMILRQLAIRSPTLQLLFFEQAKIYVINLPYRAK